MHGLQSSSVGSHRVLQTRRRKVEQRLKQYVTVAEIQAANK